MFGWFELSGYHPIVALIGGVGAFACFVGVGRLGFRLVGATVASPLTRPLEFTLGVLVVSLVVQGLAMAGLISTLAAKVLGVVLIVPGLFVVVNDLRDRWRDRREMQWSAASLAWWFPSLLVAGSLLLASVAPESRMDETGYHAMVTSRVLTDGGLRAYALPWEASVWPQFAWHYCLVPVFATVGSAAGRVVACGAALLLAFTVARVAQQHLRSTALSSLAFLCVLAGGYPIAFLSTLGPHAFGYLATFSACHAIATRQSSGLSQTPGKAAFGFGVACAGMVAGKVTMLPLAAVVLALAASDLWRDCHSNRGRVALIGGLVAPGVITLAPLAIWGWVAADSPFGVLTAELFHSHTFDAESLRLYHGTQAAHEFLWLIEATYWSLLLVICVACSLVLRADGFSRTRYRLLFACQLTVMFFLLPGEIRHFGGLQYALAIGGFCALVMRLRASGLPDYRIAVCGIAAALPWAVFGLWISTIYLPLVTGGQTPAEFLSRYSGLYVDYQNLDRILPPDARLLIGRSATTPAQYQGLGRPSTYYASRTILFDNRELKPGERNYMLYLGQGELDDDTKTPIPFDPVLPNGYRIGKLVYSNAAALFYPSRTPLQSASRRVRLDVFEVLTVP